MMTRVALGTMGVLLATTGLAGAGGLDRSFQPVGVIFEDGNYAELSYGFTSPDVSGSVAGGSLGSGQVGVDYGVPVLSFKYDLSGRLSLGVVLDQPFGADVDYDGGDPAYPAAGSTADFRSSAVTVLGRYRLTDNWSVHAGARRITTDADLLVNAALLPGVVLSYDASYDEDSDVAFVVGAAYERPAIALRVALTYSSETEFSNDVSYTSGLVGAPGPETAGSVSYTLPQSLTLDFRTGIAEGTLLFGSVRWADWSETVIDSPGYLGNPVVEYEGDIYTTTIGVGRRFTDRISAAASVTYENEASSDFDPDATRGASNLAPYDGQLGFQLAGTYAVGNGLELSGGVRYTRLGDVQTRVIGAEFQDNDALSLGLRVGYRF